MSDDDELNNYEKINPTIIQPKTSPEVVGKDISNKQQQQQVQFSGTPQDIKSSGYDPKIYINIPEEKITRILNKKLGSKIGSKLLGGKLFNRNVIPPDMDNVSFSVYKKLAKDLLMLNTPFSDNSSNKLHYREVNYAIAFFAILWLGIFLLTCAHLITGLFTISILFLLVIILFIVEEIIWIIFKGNSGTYILTDFILFLILIAIWGTMLFLYSTNLSWVSMIMMHLAIPIYCFGMLALVYIEKKRYNEIKIAAGFFNSTSSLFSFIILYFTFEFMKFNPGMMIYIFLPYVFGIMLSYVDEITELLEGWGGKYWGTTFTMKTLILLRSMFTMYILFMTIFLALKSFGFVIPGIYTVPTTFFAFL